MFVKLCTIQLQESVTRDHNIPKSSSAACPFTCELSRMEAEPDMTTTSHELAERLGISSAQIRKDLSHFGEFGKADRLPYPLFIERLTEILHLTHEHTVALVGAAWGAPSPATGASSGADSSSPASLITTSTKVGLDAGGLVVQDAAVMATKLRAEGIQVAILAVPADAAQQTTDQLIEAGIWAILSYAPVSLIVPPDVVVTATRRCSCSR